MQLSDRQIDSIIDLALAEDLGHGDVTTETLIPDGLLGEAYILVKESGCLAGMVILGRILGKVDPSLKVEVLLADGSAVKPGDRVARVSGSVAGILKAERVVLNFLQRLSGIASQTAEYVAQTQGLKAVIVDTRKTTPGLRLLEKYAVRVGGGQNHRLHLGDGILVKDNHLAALRNRGMTLKDIVTVCKDKAPQGLAVEVEVTTVEEALAAIEGGADIILLDNMSPGEMAKIVELNSGRVRIEASGGITLDNVREVAMAGVDIISIGALTHSQKSLDISLELETGTPE